MLDCSVQSHGIYLAADDTNGNLCVCSKGLVISLIIVQTE